MFELQRVLKTKLLVSNAISACLKGYILLPFVLLSYGCKEDPNSYSERLCKDAAPRADSNKIDETFLYPFQVNSVPFEISSEDLKRFSVSKKRTILKCINPEISSLSFKLPADFSIGIEAPHMTSMTIAASTRPSAMLHNYQIPLAAHIKNEKANFYNNDKLALAPLRFKRSSSDNYYCQFCESFFNFPVILNDISRSLDGQKLAQYDPATGGFYGEWAFRLKGVIDDRYPHDRVLQYGLRLDWNNTKFSELPTVLIDLEKEIQSWKVQ